MLSSWRLKSTNAVELKDVIDAVYYRKPFILALICGLTM